MGKGRRKQMIQNHISFWVIGQKALPFPLKIPLFNILLQDNRKKQYHMIIFYDINRRSSKINYSI